MTPSPLPLEIDCRAVQLRMVQQGDMVFLDCREPDEHARVSLEGAVLLPMSELMTRVDELEPYRQRPLIVYCHLGGRSLRVAQWLRHQGFSGVQSLAGGIDQWAVEIDTKLARY